MSTTQVIMNNIINDTLLNTKNIMKSLKWKHKQGIGYCARGLLWDGEEKLEKNISERMWCQDDGIAKRLFTRRLSLRY